MIETSPDAPTLFLANYRSILDAMVMWLALPRKTVFVVHPFVTTSRLWFRWLAWLGGIRTIAVSSDRPFPIRAALKSLESRTPLCMFPMEAAGAHNPSPLYQGVSFLLLKTHARLIPLVASRREGVRMLGAPLDGGDAAVPPAALAQGVPALAQPAAPLAQAVPALAQPAAPLTQPAAPLTQPAAAAGRNLLFAGSVGRSLASASPSTDVPARHADAHRIKLIASMLAMQAAGDETLWAVAQRAGDRTGPRHNLFESHRGRAMSAVSFLNFSQEYSRLIAQISSPDEIIGLILPSSARGAAVYLATVAIGRVAALLPHDRPAQTVVQCARQAGARTVIAFRAHVGAQLSYQTMGALEDAGIRVVYLDRPMLERRTSFRSLFADVPLVSGMKRDPHVPSTILFGADGTGACRAALHTDASLIAAAGQLKLAGAVRADDSIFSSLSIYDPMGLAAGVILPLVSGARSILQDHPRATARLAEIAYTRNATLVFSTPSEIAQAVHAGHPCDLQGVRSVVVSGGRADKWLQHQWLLRYGRPLLESYGLAEMGGMVAVNGWMGFCLGSAGRLFPGIEARVLDPDTSGTGRLVFNGSSAFLGYVNEGQLAPREKSQWVGSDVRARISAEGHLFLLPGSADGDATEYVDGTRMPYGEMLNSLTFTAGADGVAPKRDPEEQRDTVS